MKVSEAKALSDRRAADSLGRLIAGCWEETSDAGPYDLSDGRVDWEKVFPGDRLYVLMGIRIATHGPDYEFSVNCQERDCRRRIEWELNLNELPVRKLDDAVRSTYKAGNRFETILLSSGAKLWFKMLHGEDEARLSRLRGKGAELSLGDLLAYRVVEVEGIPLKDKKRFIEDLDMDDADFLLSEFERVDCGVDAEIEIECPHCFAVQEIELPFEPTFFMPGKGQGRKKRPGLSSSFLR